jgi:hypothetical protein
MAVGTQYNELFNVASKATKTIRSTDLIKAELEVLLGFTKYSLFFGNNMGLDLEKYLHLTNRLATFNLVRSEIEKTLMKYGRVNLLKLDITFNKENNTLDIDMTLSPKRSRRSTFDLSLTLGD